MGRHWLLDVNCVFWGVAEGLILPCTLSVCPPDTGGCTGLRGDELVTTLTKTVLPGDISVPPPVDSPPSVPWYGDALSKPFFLSAA